MSKRSRLFIAVLALGQSTCNQAILTAPSGTSLDMIVNPRFISANGGVAVVSVILIEPAGTPVPDGTVVQFFTDLGDIPEQGKTNDGVVRVNFRANGRSGEATITAFSGGGNGGGTSPTTTTPAPTTTTSGITGMAFFAAGINTAFETVTIGTEGASSVLVTADPSRITASRSTQITATVFGSAGNPLQGAPVFFDVDPALGGGASTNFMDSGGRARFTDSNGQAFDVMRTRNIVPGTATVRARVPTKGGAFLEAKVVVQIPLG